MPAAGIIGYEVHRREPFAPPDMTPASLNVRVIEKVYPQQAPDPERQGDTPARLAQNQVATFQAVAPILSVMQDEFGFDLWAPNHVASTTLRYGMHPEGVQSWDERANVRRDPSVPYGSLFELDTDAKYTLLMGR